MPEQIIVNIERPEVGIVYHPASHEAAPEDEIAACVLGIHTIARHVHNLSTMRGLQCPPEVELVLATDLWKRGM